MSATLSLHELPAQTVRRTRATAEQVATWAAGSGQRLIAVDCSRCLTRNDVLAAIARAFALPDWFGMNLDALYDALTDLDAAAVGDGLVVLLDGLPASAAVSAEARRALLAVFRDAARDFATRGVPFRVLYR
jgi:RNAse (barnase) inhibitor barstar